MRSVEFKGYSIREDGTITTLPTVRTSRNGKEYVRVIRKVRSRRLNGFHTVKLLVGNEYETHYVHQLVAEAFVPNFCEGDMVYHVDGRRSNNRADNLRWGKVV